MDKLILKDLTIGYKEILIEKINLEVSKNDLVIIFGKNGSGKSSLLRALCNIESPLSGSFNINKVEDIGILFGRSNEANYLYLYELIKFSNPKCTNDNLDKVLEYYGLLDLKFNFISNLSDGELQKAHLARLKIQDPHFLLLDEPNNYLDLKAQLNLVNELNSLRGKKGIILTTHSVEFAQKLNPSKILIIDTIKRSLLTLSDMNEEELLKFY